MERKVRLKSVNPFITCYICKGYLVDSTTITECLHTFCKSCIVKFLEENNTCPKCNTEIHQSYPLNYISFDRTMQDIVYKLVPNLPEREQKRIREFYKRRGMAVPDSGTEEPSEEVSKPSYPEPQEDEDHHRSDEQVNLCLECRGSNLKTLKRRFLRLSCQATITHLKKFVALKIYNNINRFKEVDILCNEEILGKDHTLKFVSVTRWRSKDTPLLLHYRPRVADLWPRPPLIITASIASVRCLPLLKWSDRLWGCDILWPKGFNVNHHLYTDGIFLRIGTLRGQELLQFIS